MEPFASVTSARCFDDEEANAYTEELLNWPLPALRGQRRQLGVHDFFLAHSTAQFPLL
jgi:hypothetical protein